MVLLTLDEPRPAQAVSLMLVGREHASTTVNLGKSSRRDVDDAVFLEVPVPVAWPARVAGTDLVAQGVYPLTFQVEIPATCPPAFGTSPLGSAPSTSEPSPDGLFVLYELLAAVGGPAGTEATASRLVPVPAPSRAVGYFVGARTLSKPDHPEATVVPLGPTPAPVLPGTPLPVHYQIANPSGKEIKDLTIELVRVLDYRVRSDECSHRYTGGTFTQPLGGTASSFEGEMDLMVPSGTEMTNPGTGKLFSCHWELTVDLGVHWGFDAKTSVRLDASPTAAPSPTPPRPS